VFRISKFVLERQKLRIIIEDYEGFTKEIIEVKDKDTWVPILKSFDQNSTLRVWNKEDISTKSLHFLKEKKKNLYFQLNDEDFNLNLDYCLEADNILHIRYKLSNNRDMKFSKLPGNLKGLDTVDGIDKGCIFENYGHSGRDERVRGFIMTDWGMGSAAYATAYAKKHFGDLFIDFKEQFVFGIDGILMKKFDFEDERVVIECDLIPNNTSIIIKARDPPNRNMEIIINNKSIGKYNKETLEEGFNFIIEL